MFKNGFTLKMNIIRQILHRNFFFNFQLVQLVFIFILSFLICGIERPANALDLPRPGEINESREEDASEARLKFANELRRMDEENELRKKEAVAARLKHASELRRMDEFNELSKKGEVESILKHTKRDDNRKLEEYISGKEMLDAGQTVTSTNVSFTSDGHITGRVTGPDGVTGLQNIYVYAYSWNASGSYWSGVGGSYTGADGNYNIGGLASGTYRIGFSDYYGAHITEYYNNKSSVELADDIPVTDPQTVSGIDASLALAGHISGRVTGPDGVTGLPNIYVYAYSWNASGSYWSYVSYSFSDADGNFNIGGLASGTYRVSFTDNSGAHVTEYYNNKAILDLADDISVTAPQTVTGIDASLALAGHITGKVTGPDGVIPLQNISVHCYIWNASNSYWSGVSSSNTNSVGNYSIGGLASGTYRVSFTNNSGAHLTEYYNNKASLDLADDIPVTAPQTVSGIDASLALAGHITGRVTGLDGITGLQNIHVRAYSWNASGSYWSYVSSSSITGADGNYNIGGLVSGTYRVCFEDRFGDHVTEYYNNKASVDLANDIPVTAPQTVTGINASLPPAGHITGRVTGPDGVTGLRNIYVDASIWNASGSYWSNVGYSYTGADGNYNIGGLASGTYRVSFRDWSGAHVAEYYNNDIPVTALQTVTGIDASLALAGHITGRVTGPDGVTPLQNIYVSAYIWNVSGSYWSFVSSSSATGADGNYNIGGLPSGTCRIYFWDNSGAHVTEYYNNQASLELANDIPIAAPQTVTGIDASLALAGHITGRVTGPNGVTPLQGIFVIGYTWNMSGSYWSWVSYSSTDINGNYNIGGFASGTYRVSFTDNSGTHIAEYYNNKATIDLANDIPVTAPQTVTGINASLAVPLKPVNPAIFLLLL